VNDSLEEELDIAKEQDKAGTALSAETFETPLKEVNTPRVIGVEESTSIKAVIDILQKKKMGSVVVTKDGVLTGIVTERDILLKVICIIDDLENTPITNIMTANPQSLRKEDEVAYVLNNMHVGGYRHVPIVNEKDEPISMISIKDVISWILDHFPQEITNLTGEPFRGEISREGA
jgi:CBS domain-containing protein